MGQMRDRCQPAGEPTEPLPRTARRGSDRRSSPRAVGHHGPDRPGERTAITESNLFWSVLFLYNNLHAVHHVFPKMPWWQIPGYWRAHREQILAHNGNLYFKGYGEIAGKWLLKPIFNPSHPRW